MPSHDFIKATKGVEMHGIYEKEFIESHDTHNFSISIWQTTEGGGECRAKCLRMFHNATSLPLSLAAIPQPSEFMLQLISIPISSRSFRSSPLFRFECLACK
jgi:hypothetical protein